MKDSNSTVSNICKDIMFVTCSTYDKRDNEDR